MGNEFLTTGSLAQRFFRKHSLGARWGRATGLTHIPWSQRPVPALLWAVSHIIPCGGLTAPCLCFQII